MERIPFHYGLFYFAMIGLMGRAPDTKVCYGDDGFYDFWYVPKSQEEKNIFPEHAVILAGWLDQFEIIFSRSRCEYGIAPIKPEGPKMLQVKISHPK